MTEVTAVLIVLGILLAIVTVVGHGIWIFLAWVFRLGRSRPPLDEPWGAAVVGQRACPRCHAAIGPARHECAVCGWPGGMARRPHGAALGTVREQIERLTQLGLVDAEARAKLVAAVAVEEERVAAAEAEATPAAKDTGVAPVSVGAAPAGGETAKPQAAVPAAERARRYMASREAAAAEALAEPVAPAPEAPKKREAVSRLLAAFMEEKNIRWGELVGGLLIVGCSIALVISFWSQIAERPLLKFVLLNGVTAALFGVGLYTDRRWRIHTTSHGLLVIATLLVPLNFLAIAAFTEQSPPTDLLSLGGEAVSLLVFALLVFAAGQILVPGDAPLLAAGVMIPSLMQLLVRRFAEPESPLSWLYGLAAVPIGVYLASTAIVARRRWKGWAAATADLGESDRAEADARRVATFLGLVSFATVWPLALLAYKVPPIAETLHRLSPLLVTCGLPALVVGLLFWRQVTDRRLSGLQTAGIAIGVLGALVMLGAIALAWPEPAMLLPTALVTAGVLAAVAVWFEIPAALVPAGLSLASAWLVAFHVLWGNVAWRLASHEPMADALLSATSGHALVPLVGVYGAVALALSRKRRGEARERGRMLGLVAAVVAAVSLALVMWFGFGRAGDPENATWTLGIYAVAALATAAALDHARLGRVAAALLFIALVQGIVYRYGATWQLERPLTAALLSYASLAVALCGGMSLARRWRAGSVQAVLAWSSVATSLAAAGLLLASAATTTATTLAIHLAWLAAVWLILAAIVEWPSLLVASQIAVVLAILCGVTASVETRDWYLAARHPWLDPWFLQAQGVALAGYCLLMFLVRRRWAEVAEPQAVRQAANWALEHVVAVGLLVLLACVAVYAVLPGAAQELEPLEAARGNGTAVRVVSDIAKFEIAGINHLRASDWGAWALVAAVGTVMAVGWREYRANWWQVGLVVAAAGACPLLAARWESEVAVASALRWLTAGFFAVASVLIWMRGRWGEDETAKPQAADLPRRAAGTNLRDALVAMVVLVYVAMGAYVFQAALWRGGMPLEFGWLWPYLLGWALVAGVMGVLIPRVADAKPQAVGRAVPARDVVLVLAVAPIGILVAFAVARALDQHPIVGPELGSWFRRIGWDTSYGVPLAVIALVFVGYAIRDRSSRFAFAAGLLLNTVATIVVLMRLARGGGTLDAAAWITVAQVNALVSGLVGLAWLAAVQWRRQDVRTEPLTELSSGGAKPQAAGWPLLLVTQVALSAALCGTFLIPAAVRLAMEWSPVSSLPSWVGAASHPLGWCAIGLATAAAVWLNWGRAAGQPIVATFVAALVSMFALTTLRQGRGESFAYHALMAGFCVAAWLLPVVTRGVNRLIAGTTTVERHNAWSALPVRGFDGAAVWLALWEYSTAASWWVIGALAAIAARNMVVAWREGGRGAMWIAAPLVVIAASSWWLDFFNRAVAAPGARPALAGPSANEIFGLFWINVVAVAAVAIISVAVERRHGGASVGGRSAWRGIAFHRFAAWAIVVVLLLTTGVGLIGDVVGESFAVNMWLAWAAWVAAGLVAVACSWDRDVPWPVAVLYSVGLIGVGTFLDGLDLQPPLFHWALALGLAAYSLGTSALWSVRDRIRAVAMGWGMPAAGGAKPQAAGAAWFEGGGHGWMVPLNFLLGVGVLLLVVWIEIGLENFGQRMVAAYAVGAQAFALGLLARGAVRTSLQYLALVWGVFFAVAFGWAFLPAESGPGPGPGTARLAGPWLHRLVVSVVALAVMVVVYGFGLVKFLRRENEWTRAAGRLVPVLAVLAVTLILAVLGIEVRAYLADGEVPIRPWALVAVCLALGGLAMAALMAALVPGRDPLGLSERGRTLYVYAAEALAGLLFLHIRVTMPWLFSGWFLRFWPLVVMAIAFVGVGLGELFQRRRQRVLSEPLQTTGALLPLLPVLGFWVMSSQVHYSLLLLSIGVLYAALAALRRSFWYGVLAAIAANGSLWYLLYKGEGLGFFEHPQLWLIPPAVSMLAASYINRERLTAEQSAAIRYFAAIVIYVSSTADVFINGVAEAPWLPAVLAGLSILGVLAGILLRVRAFLYLGTAFLVVALMTIIWHAAIRQQHTWILWVAGIVTGVAIIALFGLFEKRRDDVLAVVERLKQWEA